MKKFFINFMLVFCEVKYRNDEIYVYKYKVLFGKEYHIYKFLKRPQHYNCRSQIIEIHKESD